MGIVPPLVSQRRQFRRSTSLARWFWWASCSFRLHLHLHCRPRSLGRTHPNWLPEALNCVWLWHQSGAPVHCWALVSALPLLFQLEGSSKQAMPMQTDLWPRMSFSFRSWLFQNLSRSSQWLFSTSRGCLHCRCKSALLRTRVLLQPCCRGWEWMRKKLVWY